MNTTRWWAPALLVLVASCADTADTLNRGLDSISAELAELLSGDRKPNEHLQTIRSIHVANSLTFDPVVHDPLDQIRGAIRGLAVADYPTWRDAAFTLQVLSSLAVEHPVALVRTESLDAVASMAYWTFEAEVENGDGTTESELIAALRVLGDTARAETVEERSLSAVAEAVRTAAAFDFENANPLPETVSGRIFGRDLTTRLRHVRGVLLPITGSVLEPYLTDPEVLTATDRCCVALSASMIRLTLASAALTDTNVTTRTDAARLLGSVQFAQGRTALRRVILEDPEASVRREAVQAIARHGIDRAGEALIAALEDDTQSVRGAAARQLQEITAEPFGDDRQAWRRWWAERTAGRAPESGR